MSTILDEQSLSLLGNLGGIELRSIEGVRYPNVAGYSDVRLMLASGESLSVSLRIEDVDHELEVCVLVVRPSAPFDAGTKVDRFAIDGFRFSRIFKLQRCESIDWSVQQSEDYVGSHPRAHLLSEIDDEEYPNAVVVDAGVAFESDDGLAVELYADSFPLVLQLRLVVAGSAVPAPQRVALGAGR
jgi:hypothetical protein